MNIIGLYVGHNASVVALRDGELVGAISEEKFNNEKNWMGFPEKSLEWCSRLMSGKVDAVAIVNETPILPGGEMAERRKGLRALTTGSLIRKVSESLPGGLVRRLHRASYMMYSDQVKKEFERRLSKWVSPENIHYVDHHHCHALSVRYGLGVPDGSDALVFTLDGYGDFKSATVSVVRNGEMETIASTPMEHSIGAVYGKTTKFLGMKEVEHEYKVMGLAPYAKDYYLPVYNKVYRGLVQLDENTLTFTSKINTQLTEEYLRTVAVGERFDNLAAALQHFTEELIVQWIRAAIKKTGIHTIYTAGGVFMNVKANMKIAEMTEVENAFFMPSCGDETTPLGSAYHLHNQLTGKTPKAFANIYWGMGYSNGEVEKFIDDHGLREKYSIEFFEDIEEKTALLLSEFKIVARVKGRCEFGARALGNRSILANPSDMESFYTVNDQIKCRDFWMPFAPSVLYDEQDRYVVNPKRLEAPYMILGFQSTELAHKHLRAAMHQGDKTVRAQLVRREVNPDYYKLIEKFRDLSGIGGIMNTSFNLHGYPLVGTLEQALFTFENSGLRHMTLENYLITKR